MIPYIPHTDENRRRMLQAIGIASIDELFEDIPPDILVHSELPLGKPMAEEEVLCTLRRLASMNRIGIPFLGCGSYDRIIPAAVSSLASLPSFVTSYTPYQAEISQGLLQAIFEFQTMICELTDLDIANASLYDGHTAALEAASMMLRTKRKSSVIIVSETVHPFTWQVLRTWAFGTPYTIMPIAQHNGVTDTTRLSSLLSDEVAGVIVQSPNRYGFLEDYTDMASLVHANGSLLAISSDPLSLALQKSQGEWGADIAIGDTQPLGIPSAFGGPSCGYMAVREDLMRKLPGRIVGQTVDVHGKRAFVLTLQAREQHIKRERATSNICSNQALAALTTAIHISLVGWDGMVDAARQSKDKAHYLADAMTQLDSVALAWEQPFWCEFPLRFTSSEQMELLLTELRTKDIYGGVRLGRLTGKEEDAATLVVAVTEKRTRLELDTYIETARRVLT